MSFIDRAIYMLFHSAVVHIILKIVIIQLIELNRYNPITKNVLQLLAMMP